MLLPWLPCSWENTSVIQPTSMHITFAIKFQCRTVNHTTTHVLPPHDSAAAVLSLGWEDYPDQAVWNCLSVCTVPDKSASVSAAQQHSVQWKQNPWLCCKPERLNLKQKHRIASIRYTAPYTYAHCTHRYRTACSRSAYTLTIHAASSESATCIQTT